MFPSLRASFMAMTRSSVRRCPSHCPTSWDLNSNDWVEKESTIFRLVFSTALAHRDIRKRKPTVNSRENSIRILFCNLIIHTSIRFVKVQIPEKYSKYIFPLLYYTICVN